MNINCKIMLNYNSSKQAKHILSSVQIDDVKFMNSRRNNNKIITEIQTKSVPSMLHTINDFLSCVSIAENIIKKNH